MAAHTTALLVDDDARLGTLVTEYLGKHEIDVTVAADGERGLAILGRGHFDVVLLDVMLPGADGLEVCRRIRAAPEMAPVPVIMLTARGDDVDRIVGLELGADDYLPKPFNPRELLARLRAVLRRRRGGQRASVLRFGPIEIDPGARKVRVDGAERVLTSHQFDLLHELARSAGRVVSRAALLERVRDSDALERSVDLHVSRIRAAIEKDPKSPRLIVTVRGAGYMFAREPQGTGQP